MTLHDPTPGSPPARPPALRDEMSEARRDELLTVLPPERLREHVETLRNEIAALTGDAAGSRTPPMIGPGSVDWVGLGRQAHAAAGHAQLLGFVEIGRLLNAMEAAAKRADLAQLEAARDGLSAQLALGGPAAPAP